MRNSCLARGGFPLPYVDQMQHSRAFGHYRWQRSVERHCRRYSPGSAQKHIPLPETSSLARKRTFDVTVTIENGVATLRGMVFDDWDMRQAMRISRRIAGVKRVINDLDIETGGD